MIVTSITCVVSMVYYIVATIYLVTQMLKAKWRVLLHRHLFGGGGAKKIRAKLIWSFTEA